MARILVVEDEPAMQLGLKDNLEMEGYEITLAGDGETGAQLAITGTFDLILLDVMLPRLSGFDVCKKVRVQRRLRAAAMRWCNSWPCRITRN